MKQTIMKSITEIFPKFTFIFELFMCPKVTLLTVTGARSDAFTVFKNGRSKFGGVDQLKSYTVGTLPVGVEGDTAYVTDATAPTYLGVVVGGGAVKCPVFCNGTNWVCG